MIFQLELLSELGFKTQASGYSYLLSYRNFAAANNVTDHGSWSAVEIQISMTMG